VKPSAAHPELSGEVIPMTSGGVIRYRAWPAKRHPVRLVLAIAAVVGGTAVVGYVLQNAFWAAMALIGLSLTAAAFLFPTLVALDGPTLVIRHLGTPRSHDLRTFRRIEASRDMVPRVELLPRARLSPMDTLSGVILPLPDDQAAAERVITHLRRWVGKNPTGRFALDLDHVPEDDLEQTD
jgi:hypothetical protein